MEFRFCNTEATTHAESAQSMKKESLYCIKNHPHLDKEATASRYVPCLRHADLILSFMLFVAHFFTKINHFLIDWMLIFLI